MLQKIPQSTTIHYDGIKVHYHENAKLYDHNISLDWHIAFIGVAIKDLLKVFQMISQSITIHKDGVKVHHKLANEQSVHLCNKKHEGMKVLRMLEILNSITRIHIAHPFF